jgi:Uma2 family endonuclease
MPLATLTPPAFTPQRPRSQRLLTAADLAAMPREMNGQAVRYELFDGELIVMAPPGGDHGLKQKAIITQLVIGPESAGLGVTYPGVGLVLRRDPDRVVEPDAFFVLKASLPVQYSREGYVLTIPEIVIEVRSKNDRVSEIEAKRDEYLDAGVKEVWLLDPKTRSITIATSSHESLTFQIDDSLTTTLLPGFAVPVAAIFA